MPTAACRHGARFTDCGSGSTDDAIVRAIVAIVRALGLDVVMKGVETEQQLAFLREIGCHQVQGFLVARPQPAEQRVGISSRVGTELLTE